MRLRDNEAVTLDPLPLTATTFSASFNFDNAFVQNHAVRKLHTPGLAVQLAIGQHRREQLMRGGNGAQRGPRPVCSDVNNGLAINRRHLFFSYPSSRTHSHSARGDAHRPS
jgi:hypothetical protein